MMKRIGIAAVLVFAGLTSLRAGTYGNFNYSESGGEITITGYIGAGGAVSIPEKVHSGDDTHEHHNFPVTAIGPEVFRGLTSVTSVTIPNSVISVGNYAFEGCTSLASVTIGSGVTSIGWHAFEGCTSLTSVAIPGSVTSIRASTFSGCTSLANVTIGDSVTSIGEYAFKGCTSLASVTIPNSVTHVGDDAFRDCENLASVTIGSSVKFIGFNAFRDCESLASVTIPDSVTSIGDYAFSGCTSLESVTIGNSVTSIGRSMFSSCHSLTSVTIPDSVTFIGDYTFFGCRSLESVTIGNSVTSIGNYAFFGCENLASVTIPDSVTTIGDNVFETCTGLTSVTIGNGVTSIGDYAFRVCRNLESVTIGNSVASIGEGAFMDCINLRRVTIPDSVTSIKWSTFRECESLEKITIGKGVTIIESRAFHGCFNLAVACFKGNAPEVEDAHGTLFIGSSEVVVHYQHGTTGWPEEPDDELDVVRWQNRPLILCNCDEDESLVIKINSPDAGQQYQQGSGLRVTGVVEQPSSYQGGVLVNLKIEYPAKPLGHAMHDVRELEPDSNGEFEWDTFFTVCAPPGTWKITAEARCTNSNDRAKTDREIEVTELPALSSGDVFNNISTLLGGWHNSSDIPEGINDPEVIAILGKNPTGMKVNFWSNRAKYRDVLGRFTCSALAINTLDYFNSIRFSSNQAERMLMQGVDYGPVYNGLGWLGDMFRWHIAVTIYDKQQNVTHPWPSQDNNASYVLEPWTQQRKIVYDSGSWAAMFGANRVPGDSDPFYAGQYPTSGSGGTYEPEAELSVIFKRERDIRLMTDSPVYPRVVDSEGRTTGRLPDGTAVNEIPDAEYTYVMKEEDGTYSSFIKVPECEYQLFIVGYEDGVFDLTISSYDDAMGYNIVGYTNQPTRAGADAVIALVPAELPNQQLILHDGTRVDPDFTFYDPPEDSAPAGSVPAYRFYSYGAPESTFTHLWTINETEKDVIMTWPSWQYEGIAWYALTNMPEGAVPLYRLYEPNIRRHLYTVSATEYVTLDGGSWNGEDVQYFVYITNPLPGLVPTYRFYHSANQNHHFTIDENEKATIIATPEWGYTYEGIAFSVFASDAPSLRHAGMLAGVVHEYSYSRAGLTYLPEADYTGDGVSDTVVYDENTGLWYILPSGQELEISDIRLEIAPLAQWGGPGFIAVPGDYNGDGVFDLAVYEQETGCWYIRTVEGEIILWDEQWGGPGFEPVPGDHTGDGTSDLCVREHATGVLRVMPVHR